MVEKAERLAGVVSFYPQRHLAQVDRQLVLVHRVNALADDVADGVSVLGGVRLFFAGADFRQLARDSAGGGEQEVSRPGGGVAHAQGQQRALLLRFRPRGGEARVHDGRERAVRQLRHQLRRRVVRPGSLALRPRRQRERRPPAAVWGSVYLRSVVQEALVNRA